MKKLRRVPPHGNLGFTPYRLVKQFLLGSRTWSLSLFWAGSSSLASNTAPEREDAVDTCRHHLPAGFLIDSPVHRQGPGVSRPPPRSSAGWPWAFGEDHVEFPFPGGAHHAGRPPTTYSKRCLLMDQMGVWPAVSCLPYCGTPASNSSSLHPDHTFIPFGIDRIAFVASGLFCRQNPRPPWLKRPPGVTFPLLTPRRNSPTYSGEPPERRHEPPENRSRSAGSAGKTADVRLHVPGTYGDTYPAGRAMTAGPPAPGRNGGDVPRGR